MEDLVKHRRLQWAPAHCGIEGNGSADDLGHGETGGRPSLKRPLADQGSSLCGLTSMARQLVRVTIQATPREHAAAPYSRRGPRGRRFDAPDKGGPLGPLAPVRAPNRLSPLSGVPAVPRQAVLHGTLCCVPRRG